MFSEFLHTLDPTYGPYNQLSSASHLLLYKRLAAKKRYYKRCWLMIGHSGQIGPSISV